MGSIWHLLLILLNTGAVSSTLFLQSSITDFDKTLIRKKYSESSQEISKCTETRTYSITKTVYVTETVHISLTAAYSPDKTVVKSKPYYTLNTYSSHRSSIASITNVNTLHRDKKFTSNVALIQTTMSSSNAVLFTPYYVTYTNLFASIILSNSFGTTSPISESNVKISASHDSISNYRKSSSSEYNSQNKSVMNVIYTSLNCPAGISTPILSFVNLESVSKTVIRVSEIISSIAPNPEFTLPSEIQDSSRFSSANLERVLETTMRVSESILSIAPNPQFTLPSEMQYSSRFSSANLERISKTTIRVSESISSIAPNPVFSLPSIIVDSYSKSIKSEIKTTYGMKPSDSFIKTSLSLQSQTPTLDMSIDNVFKYTASEYQPIQYTSESDKLSVSPSTSVPIMEISSSIIETTKQPTTRSSTKTTQMPRDDAVASVKNLSKITPENIQESLKKLSNLVKSTYDEDRTNEQFNDTKLIVDKMEEAANIKMNIQQGKEFVKVASAVLKKDLRSVSDVKSVSKLANKIVISIDKFVSNVNLSRQSNVSYNFDNLAVEVFNVDSIENAVRVFQVQSSDKNDLRTEVSKEVRINQNATAAIKLPKDALDNLIRAESSVRLSFTAMNNPILFNQPPEDIGKHFQLFNTVISATAGLKGSLKIENEKVLITFKLDESNNTEFLCVFWDTANSRWSKSGCSAEFNSTNKQYVTCKCSHLTHFGIFMGKTELSKPLEIATIIGLVLSMVGLTIIILTFLLFKKLRCHNHQKVLFCLSLTLLLTYIVFLAGIKATKNELGCRVVAGLLHYLLLSSFIWMLCEAVLQYMGFVRVLGSHIDKFIWKAGAISWGLPLLVVLITFGASKDNYLSKTQHQSINFCWLRPVLTYYGFILPVGLILLINLVVFVLVMKSIIQRPRSVSQKKSGDKTDCVTINASVGFSLLLGLVWLFGLLSLAEGNHSVLTYLFVVVVALHGFLLFLFFTLRDKNIREHWATLFRHCLQPKRTYYRKKELTSTTVKTVKSVDTMSLEMSSSGNITGITDEKVRPRCDIVSVPYADEDPDSTKL